MTAITVTVMIDTVMAEDTQYTIDELAALARIPSRTIRYYQSEGALPKPVIKGRVAYYDQRHVERLGQISVLQDRGLQIKAIKDVVVRADKGEFSLAEWLGSHDQLSTPWAVDRPKVLTEEEIAGELAGRRPGLLGELVQMRVVERRADAWLVPSPTLWSLALRLDSAGVPLEAAAGAARIVRKQVGKLAEDLVAYFLKNADALGDDLPAAYAELRPVSLEAVRALFAHEMERTLRKATESGAAAKLTRGRAKKKSRP